MTQPDTFNDFGSALRMREVIARLVREEMARQRPPARYGKVYDFNRFTFVAQVQFPGDAETTRVKFHQYMQPTRRIVADGDLFADVVRVEGTPGNLWITGIANGTTFSDQPILNLPSLRGGLFMHQQVAKFFGGSVGDLPAINQAWYVGKWVNTSSFAADGLAHLEVVVRHTLFSAITKKYEIALRANDTQDAWKKCAPIFDTGPWADNDFELEVKTGSDSVELRVRRTKENTGGGFTPGGYNVDVWFYGEDWDKDYTATPAITADPAPSRFHGTTSTSAEAKGPFLSPAMNAPRLAQHLLAGGGAMSYSTAFGPIFKWTNRFIIMGMGRSHLVPDGYFEVPVPVGGVTIPVYGKSGTDSTSTVVSGVNLDNWDSLYYEIPWGSTATGIEANFRIVQYNDGAKKFQVPSHWVHIATKMGDSNFPHIQVGTGEIIDIPRNLSLGANWSALGFPWATPAWRVMQGNRVELEGVVKTSVARAVDQTIAQLPVNFCPSTPKMFPAKAITGAGGIVVTETGIIRNMSTMAINDWISLDGISFARGQ